MNVSLKPVNGMLLDTATPRAQDRAAPSSDSDHEEDPMRIRLLVTAFLAVLAFSGAAAAQEMCPTETYAAEAYPLDDYGFVAVDPGSIASMDVSGDSISKAFNG